MIAKINPLLPKGGLPFVKFAAGNGFSVQDSIIKGCHLPELADAVADYNRAVERKLAGLNVVAVEATTWPVEELPGYGDAMENARIEKGVEAFRAKVESGTLPNCRCELCQAEEARVAGIVREETAKGHAAGMEARTAFVQMVGRAKRNHTPGAGKTASQVGEEQDAADPRREDSPAGVLQRFAPLLAMLAACGDLADMIPDEHAEALDEPPSPECKALLEASGMIHRAPGGMAVLAVPASLGDKFTQALIGDIRNNRVACLRKRLEDAGLIAPL